MPSVGPSALQVFEEHDLSPHPTPSPRSHCICLTGTPLASFWLWWVP